MRFRNRQHAGEQLFHRLNDAGLHRPVVFGLPRGGVPVAAEIALGLHAPLDVFVARKIGAPGHREFGIGAVAEGGAIVADHDAVRMLDLTGSDFEELAERERLELQRRVQRYRGGRTLCDTNGRDVLLVDDGLATGVTAEAAVRALRELPARRVIVAVPTGSREAVRRLSAIADEVFCLVSPEHFVAVGQWYDDFDQTTDDEVLGLLRRAHQRETIESS